MSAIAPIHLVSQAEELLVVAVERLSSATTLAEVVNIGDLARVVRECLELRDKGSSAHALAYETVILANARAGQLTRELPQAKRGPTADTEVLSAEPTKPKGQAIAELGLTRQQVSRLELLAAIPHDELRARIDAAKEDILAGKRPPEITAVTSGSKHDGDMFSTPAVYVEAARQVLGSIEFDPATNESAQQRVVKAERYFTAATNGLAQPWVAETMWHNPPYSRGLINQFVDKHVEAIAAAAAGQPGVKSAIALVNTDNSTEWYQRMLESCTALCLPKGRIAFELDGKPAVGNEHPQTFFYNGCKLPLFSKVFSEFGTVCLVHRARRSK